VRLNGIRIAGASGIFKRHDYNLGHFEQVPYNNSTLRSVYHVRAYDVFKLSLLSPGPEVMTSHDWPEGIYNHGDTAALLRTKPWFQEGIDKKDLGNPHMMTLMKTLRPHWWFSAHMHVRFRAEYDHTSQDASDGGKTQSGPTQGRSPGPPRTNTVTNPDEIVMEEEDWGDDQLTSGLPTAPSMSARNKGETVMDDGNDQPAATTSSTTQMEEKIDSSNNIIGPAAVPSNDVSSSPRPPSVTKFLALDKCLPERKFLEVNLWSAHDCDLN
jgi:lariat debranching enzyme